MLKQGTYHDVGGVAVTQRGSENWQDVFDYDESVKLDHLTVFKDTIVIHGRQDGLGQIWVSRVE